MFNPDGCFCCEPPEDPCTLSGCTWSSTEMSDSDLTAGTTYNNPSSGSTPDGTYEVTNAQDTSTGNNAPCRKITIETAIAPSKAESVYAICWKDNATHNPSTQCTLTSVSFCVESKRHADADSGLTDGVVFVVRQGGKIYATATQSVGVNWKRASGTYTSASFTWVNGTGNPNFTATGSAIEFGFALKLAVPKDGTPYDVVMFDNLCVKRSSCNCQCLIRNNQDEFIASFSGVVFDIHRYGVTAQWNSDFSNSLASIVNNSSFSFYRFTTNSNTYNQDAVDFPASIDGSSVTIRIRGPNSFLSCSPVFGYGFIYNMHVSVLETGAGCTMLLTFRTVDQSQCDQSSPVSASLSGYTSVVTCNFFSPTPSTVDVSGAGCTISL